MTRIARHWFTETTAIGLLTIADTRFSVFTLEDTPRQDGIKLPKITAICQGLHKCQLTYSPRFKKILPIIYNRPDFTLVSDQGVTWSGVRIHDGNFAVDTDACPIVGKRVTKDHLSLIDSDNALESLLEQLIIKYGTFKEFEIEIINQQKPI